MINLGTVFLSNTYMNLHVGGQCSMRDVSITCTYIYLYTRSAAINIIGASTYYICYVNVGIDKQIN